MRTLFPLLFWLGCSGAPATSGVSVEPPEMGPREVPVRPALPPEVALTERAETYEVTGQTEADLTASLNARTPFRTEDGTTARFFAFTAFDLDVSFETVPDARGCGLEDLTVALDLVITLPEWTEASGASAEATAWYADVLDALTVHETGHARMNMHAARALAETLRPMRADTCERLQREADAASGAVQAQYRAFNAAYDRTTERGRRQRRDLFPDANR